MSDEEFVRTLADGPIGRWSTSEGTWPAVTPPSTWEFHVDGTGSRTYENLGGAQSSIFRWHAVKKHVVALCFDTTVDEVEQLWQVVPYELEIADPDSAAHIVMRRSGSNDFLFGSGPLRYLGLAR